MGKIGLALFCLLLVSIAVVSQTSAQESSTEQTREVKFMLEPVGGGSDLWNDRAPGSNEYFWIDGHNLDGIWNYTMWFDVGHNLGTNRFKVERMYALVYGPYEGEADVAWYINDIECANLTAVHRGNYLTEFNQECIDSVNENDGLNRFYRYADEGIGGSAWSRLPIIEGTMYPMH